MTDENSNPSEEPMEGKDLSRDDPAPEEESLKGGADGKAKALGGKGLGDYVKTDRNERAYE